MSQESKLVKNYWGRVALIIALILLVGITSSGGVYVWQNSLFKSVRADLQSQVNILAEQLITQEITQTLNSDFEVDQKDLNDESFSVNQAQNSRNNVTEAVSICMGDKIYEREDDKISFSYPSNFEEKTIVIHSYPDGKE